MRWSIIWILARLVLLALGIFAFAGLMNQDTNFDPLSGLACGAVLFAFVFSTVTKKSAGKERLLSITSPFWPPWKYPQAYWFTTGSLIFLSSVVNLIFRSSDPAAIRFYAGMTFLGTGLVAGAILARHRLSRTQ